MDKECYRDVLKNVKQFRLLRFENMAPGMKNGGRLNVTPNDVVNVTGVEEE